MKIINTHSEHQSQNMKSGNIMYKKFALMLVLSFVAMYIIMYAMVDKIFNVIPNVNQFYMAGLITMPNAHTGACYYGQHVHEKKVECDAYLFRLCWNDRYFFCMHQQAAVGDKQFLKSMIPHHAAAVLMVENASIHDPEIKELANKIISSQTEEISQMKAKLKAMNTAK